MVDRHDIAVRFHQILHNHLSHRLSLRCREQRAESGEHECFCSRLSALSSPLFPRTGNHDLTAPSVSARTKYFCRTRKSTTTGTLMMNDAAISPGQLVANSVKKRCNPTGSVNSCLSFRKVSA